MRFASVVSVALGAVFAVHPRQMRALAAYRFDAERIRTISVPTLLLLGGETPSAAARQSIEALAKAILEFAAGSGARPGAVN